jgi:hypothetical protein
MILEKGCAERGCACYDIRVDEGVEMVRELTDEEILEVWKENCHSINITDFARAILAKACNRPRQGNTCKKGVLND